MQLVAKRIKAISNKGTQYEYIGIYVNVNKDKQVLIGKYFDLVDASKELMNLCGVEIEEEQK